MKRIPRLTEIFSLESRQRELLKLEETDRVFYRKDTDKVYECEHGQSAGQFECAICNSRRPE